MVWVLPPPTLPRIKKCRASRSRPSGIDGTRATPSPWIRDSLAQARAKAFRPRPPAPDQRRSHVPAFLFHFGWRPSSTGSRIRARGPRTAAPEPTVRHRQLRIRAAPKSGPWRCHSALQSWQAAVLRAYGASRESMTSSGRPPAFWRQCRVPHRPVTPPALASLMTKANGARQANSALHLLGYMLRSPSIGIVTKP
jgi:hypothetical protein